MSKPKETVRMSDMDPGHLARLDSQDFDTLSEQLCNTGKTLTQLMGGGPADWAAALAVASRVAQAAAAAAEKNEAWVEGFIRGKVEEKLPAITSAVAAHRINKDDVLLIPLGGSKEPPGDAK